MCPASKTKSAAFQIETPRLVLREFQLRDQAAIADMQSDVRVAGMLGSGVRSRPRAMAEGMLWITYGRALRGDLAMVAIADKHSGDFLGMGFLGPIPNGDHQLGYRLRHDAWGKGYATEAAEALKTYALRDCGLPRLIAYTRQDNFGSARVLRKIGMKDVGIRLVSGYHALVFQVAES